MPLFSSILGHQLWSSWLESPQKSNKTIQHLGAGFEFPRLHTRKSAPYLVLNNYTDLLTVQKPVCAS